MKKQTNQNSKMPVSLLFMVGFLMFFSVPVMAEIMQPNPSINLQDAWNSLFGSGSNNFNTTKTVITLIFAAVLFFFAGWCLFGLYTACFVSKSIKQHEFIMYLLRLLLVLLTGVVLWGSGT